MGIRNLTRRLCHKADDSIWPGTDSDHSNMQEQATRSKIAIIDGPSLVHRSYDSGRRRYPFVDDRLRFDYALIAQVFVQYLEELEERGFTLHKLYFDGALPEPKRATRIQRARDNTRRTDFSREVATGTTGREHFEPTFHNGLLATYQYFSPQPPFLVSAVIEALHRSRFASYVELVPGEADHWCRRAAVDASKQHPDKTVVIFTADSDFLVHDSPQNTYVAMIHAVMETEVYNSYKIAASLGVDNMLRVGFHMHMNDQLALSTAASFCGRALSPQEQVKYAEFLDQVNGVELLHDVNLTREQQACLQYTDPRLSELIYQINHLAHQEHASSSSQQLLGPTLFHAPWFEDKTRASSWMPSQQVRALAYSILTAGTTVRTVYEHDRRGQEPTFVAIALHDNVVAHLSAWLLWLQEQLKSTQDAGLSCAWRIVSMLTLVQSVRQTVPTLDDVVDVLLANDYASMSRFHLAAELRATLYSYRILKQVSSYAEASKPGDPRLRTMLADLSSTLATLPPMTELFEGIPSDQTAAVEDFFKRHHPEILNRATSSTASTARTQRGQTANRASPYAVHPQRTKLKKEAEKSQKQSRGLASNRFLILSDNE